MNTLILACAGKGERADLGKNKLLYNLGDKTVLEESLSKFVTSGLIDRYIVVVSKKDEKEIKKILPEGIETVIGGKTRTESVKKALSLVDSGIVLIHDGARPFVTAKIISDCIDSAVKHGSGITAIPSPNTICEEKDGIIKNYLGKDKLYQIQTPQAFKVEQIKKAYNGIKDKSFNDDGEIYKEYIGDVHLVKGDSKNVKLTYKEDFTENNIKDYRVGTGFDCHRLTENRKLILGGVEIPHNKGLLGHSDADVLTHAVMDALLSACSLRDIGYYFPDKDDKYKDANSIELLKRVLKMIKEKGYKVNNISAVIMADKPKLLSFIPKITQNLSNVLNIGTERVGIGATTLEGLGFIGREEGICVRATASLIK